MGAGRLLKMQVGCYQLRLFLNLIGFQFPVASWMIVHACPLHHHALLWGHFGRNTEGLWRNGINVTEGRMGNRPSDRISKNLHCRNSGGFVSMYLESQFFPKDIVMLQVKIL